MPKRLVIIGAGGHGKVVADLADKLGYTDILFLDDCLSGECLGYPIVGTSKDIEAFQDEHTQFVIAVGNNAFRKKLAQTYDLNWVTLIHPSAQIGKGGTMGTGTVVLECAKLNACAHIGNHCIINSGAFIGHDCVIEDFVHVSANAAVGGGTAVGTGSFVAIGATVRNSISICADCTIGAGAVAVKSITEPGTYVGSPARKMHKQHEAKE